MLKINRREVCHQEEMRQLAEDIGARLVIGDIVLLSGEIGTGKSTFARAVIRAAAEDQLLEVPSPSFTILQSYQIGDAIWNHLDLYRVTNFDELTEIGISEAMANSVTLVEWPERATLTLDTDPISVTISFIKNNFGQADQADNARMIEISTDTTRSSAITRSFKAREFLASCSLASAIRTPIPKDASTRTFERIAYEGKSYILIDWAPTTDPYMRDYMAETSLAITPEPYLAIAGALNLSGLSAPKVIATDLTNGFLLIEDFGRDKIITANNQPITERYKLAVKALSFLHSKPRPRKLATNNKEYSLPRYTTDKMLGEVELFCDWYFPYRYHALTGQLKNTFINTWREILISMPQLPATWLLRDVHSPNILYLEQRHGVKKIGLIDIQDALWGPPAYDLASLVMDARTTIEPVLQAELINHYQNMLNIYHKQHSTTAQLELPPFEQFSTCFTIVASQRVMRILGVFVRLAKRDGKEHYLANIPRNEQYLEQLLIKPEMTKMAKWYNHARDH